MKYQNPLSYILKLNGSKRDIGMLMQYTCSLILLNSNILRCALIFLLLTAMMMRFWDVWIKEGFLSSLGVRRQKVVRNSQTFAEENILLGRGSTQQFILDPWWIRIHNSFCNMNYSEWTATNPMWFFYLRWIFSVHFRCVCNFKKLHFWESSLYWLTWLVEKSMVWLQPQKGLPWTTVWNNRKKKKGKDMQRFFARSGGWVHFINADDGCE